MQLSLSFVKYAIIAIVFAVKVMYALLIKQFLRYISRWGTLNLNVNYYTGFIIIIIRL